MAQTHDQIGDLVKQAIQSGATVYNDQTLFVSMQKHEDVNRFVRSLQAEVIVDGCGVYYILKEPNMNLFLFEQEVRLSA